jgi:hypothetical protein
MEEKIKKNKERKIQQIHIRNKAKKERKKERN